MNFSLTDILRIIISDNFIWIFCVFIGGMALCFYVKFYQLSDPILKEICTAVYRVKESGGDKYSFPEEYYDFDEWMLKTKYLKNCWREFSETLLLPGEDFDDGKEVIMNTHLPAVYFNQKNLLLPNVNMRLFSAIPNMLTGMGILGTFLGLSVGIYFAAPGLNSDDIHDAKHALNILLNGASLAFITSIVGLFSSLVFSFIEKRRIHKFNRTCQELVSEFDLRVEYFSAERLASKNLAESQKQSVALQSFANDLAVSLGQVMEQSIAQPMIDAIEGLRNDQHSANDETITKLMEEFSKSITGAAGEEMKAFASNIKTMSDTLEMQIKSLSEGQELMQKIAQEAVSNMSEAMHEGSDKINTGIDLAVQSLIENTQRSIDTVSQQLDEASLKLAQNLEKGLDGFEVILDKLTDTADNYQNMTNANKVLFTDVSQSITVIRDLVKESEQLNDEFKDTAQMYQGYIQSLNQSSNKLYESNNIVQSTFTKLKDIQTELSNVWGSYEKRFTDIDTSMEGVFKSISTGLDAYASQTDEYILGLDKHSAGVVQNLAAATQEISDSIEALGDNLEKRTDVFESSVESISDTAKEELSKYKTELQSLTTNA